MDKWQQVFPTGVSECLREYFRNKSMWKNCFVNYVDYQRCIKLKGADYKECDYFKQVSNSLCPNHWLEKFEEQVENGSFPVDF